MKVKHRVTCRYLVRPLQSAHEEGDLLHDGKVMLKLLQLLVEPGGAEERLA